MNPILAFKDMRDKMINKILCVLLIWLGEYCWRKVGKERARMSFW
jgi:hypothetical protein